MAKSTSPDNGSGVFSTLQELTAEFVLDDESQPKWGDGQVIEEPLLPSVTCPGSISGASRNPVPRGEGLALDRTDRGKAGSSASEAQSFAAEIDSLRIALQRLQLAFSCTTTIEEHLKLASAISLIYSLSRILCGASIVRIVYPASLRDTQNYLASNCLPEFNRETIAALDVVMKECGRT